MPSLPSPSRTRALQCRFLAGASAVVLMLAATGADARMLGGTTTPAAAAASSAAAAAQQAAAIAAQSQASLMRATQALRALQAAQAGARAAASAASTNGVTDGLSAGGLIVDPRVAAGAINLWQNISQPVPTTANGLTTVTLTQTAERAVATWQQFNVGRNTTVRFDQSAGATSSGNSWTVLNRIDAAGSPSRILGQIRADGTVLIINPNGIIFGAGS